jgi:hypothetical protein
VPANHTTRAPRVFASVRSRSCSSEAQNTRKKRANRGERRTVRVRRGDSNEHAGDGGARAREQARRWLRDARICAGGMKREGGASSVTLLKDSTGVYSMYFTFRLIPLPYNGDIWTILALYPPWYRPGTHMILSRLLLWEL